MVILPHPNVRRHRLFSGFSFNYQNQVVNFFLLNHHEVRFFIYLFLLSRFISLSLLLFVIFCGKLGSSKKFKAGLLHHRDKGPLLDDELGHKNKTSKKINLDLMLNGYIWCYNSDSIINIIFTSLRLEYVISSKPYPDLNPHNDNS